ncbi:MAG: YeeE/YedE family protein [Deltaproteobacteria bacterium]|nr:YeeE/YedE family protein [Deltaproteobacteria bacterium]
MKKESLCSQMWKEIKKGYDFFFIKDMPLWVAGIGIGILALMIFLWRYPWGISSGYGNWGNQIYYYLGLGKLIGMKQAPLTPWTHPVSVMNIAMILGATGAAMMKGQFAAYRAPGREYVKGFIGGALMGIGSSFANGCIEGGFYTAVGVFSMGGFMMMIGLALGSILGVKYLIWEMLNWPVKVPNQKPKERKKNPLINKSKVYPYVGGGIYILICLSFYVYSSFDKTVIGGMAFFGLWVGFFMQRSRFCLQRTFRNPFMTGDYEMVKAVILSLIIYSAGSAVIKYGFFQPDTHGIDHRFWLGSLSGGFIFGLGMVIAGACASSSLWRAGEGNTKIWLAITGFITVYPAVKYAVANTALGPFLGKGVYAVDIFGWTGTPVFYVCFFMLWYLLAVYNAKTEKFVISF